jgi:hypothetical protein
MKFFDLKNFSKTQWTSLGCAVFILVVFSWNEYEKSQPFDEAAKGLEEVVKKDKEIDCKYLRQMQNWSEYEKKKC